MRPNLIFELLDLAISLTQSQLDGSNVERTLLDIAQKSVQAYEDQTGEMLDPRLIRSQTRL